MKNSKLLLLIVVIAFSTFKSKARGIPVDATYEIRTFNESDGPVALLESLLIKFKKNNVFIGKTDSTFWNWEVQGNNMDGYINLFVSKEHGIGWVFYLGEDTLKVIISTDYKSTRDPRLLSITSTMNESLYYIENKEPDCNSQFVVYELKNPADSDLQYEGDYALEILSNKPCANGKWKVKASKQDVIMKIQVTAIFTALMVQNIRYLFKDFVLEENE